MAQVMEDFSSTMFKRDRRSPLSRSSNHRNLCTATAAIQTITQARGRSIVSIDSNKSNNGGVLVKIVMTKKELKQMVASMGLEKSSTSNSNHRAALEQMMHVLRKKQMNRAENWQPALQSIPEEF